MHREPFSVEVEAPGARSFHRDGYHYVALPPGAEYKLRLGNHNNTKCDAEVYIDNEHVGTWRIEAGETISIERPADESRRFVFVRERSQIARETGAISGAYANGLVKVIFKPAKQRPRAVVTEYPRRESAAPLGAALSAQPMGLGLAAAPSLRASTATPTGGTMLRAPQYESGVTVLGEESYQTFGSARGLRHDEIDWNNVTEIIIRLVAEEREQYAPLSPRRRPASPPRIDSYGRLGDYSGSYRTLPPSSGYSVPPRFGGYGYSR